VIGKLLYLEKSTRPDISCAVHQCARDCANPEIQHTAAVKRIGRYLLGTKDKGLIMRQNQEGMEYWLDAAHASEWNNKTASNDPNTARSRMGYLITYAGCPMHWSSKMQIEIALSTIEAEYIALSQVSFNTIMYSVRTSMHNYYAQEEPSPDSSSREQADSELRSIQTSHG